MNSLPNSRERGFIFYQGPSLLDGAPIVAIATLNTDNEKTGRLVQTWILRADLDPVAAAREGADVSICGNCPLRGTSEDGHNRGRGCYVMLHTAPLAVYRTFRAGRYPRLSARRHRARLAGRGLRIGSYGDPAAVPARHWKRLRQLCTGRTAPGYSHQWARKRFQWLRSHVMASVHSAEHAERAHAAGWRTFRTVSDVSECGPREIVCPASPEGGDKSTCERCGLCNGRAGTDDNRPSIVIVAHGRAGKPAAVQRAGRLELQLV